MSTGLKISKSRYGFHGVQENIKKKSGKTGFHSLLEAEIRIMQIILSFHGLAMSC